MRNLLVASVFCLPFAAFATEKINLRETYTVTLPKVDLFNARNNVVLSAEWDYKNQLSKNEYIDSNSFIADIKSYLNQYPDKKDYLEIINKNLSMYLLKKYPQIHTLTLKIISAPTAQDKYLHSSAVTINR